MDGPDKIKPAGEREMKTPPVWMEARCGSVTGGGGNNWFLPDQCHQTAIDGGFFSPIAVARTHFIKCGWRIIDNEWWCPVCAKILNSA